MPADETNSPAPETQGFAPSERTPDIQLARQGRVGRIMLNRPRAINALTVDMVDAVADALEAWRDDDTVTAITIEGAGDRGLCAGGDVKGVREAFVAGKPEAAFDFFRREYRMNGIIADYPKLIVSYQDGIVMGGGVGISAFAGLRVATERTKVAMPETIIGFFPDVGALYLLSRAPGGCGAYLALTGESITGPDAVHVGLSDVVIDAASWASVLERLAAGANASAATEGLTKKHDAPLAANQLWIDGCFGSAPDFRPAADVLASLEASDADGAQDAASALQARSPLSVAATLEALRRAANMPSVHDVLEQDMRLAKGLIEHGDFVEGVRAQLVDKDRSPAWSQASVTEVTDTDVERLFA